MAPLLIVSMPKLMWNAILAIVRSRFSKGIPVLTYVPDKYYAFITTTGITNPPDFCTPNMSVRGAVVLANGKCRIIIEAHKCTIDDFRRQIRQTTEHNNNNACECYD